MSSMRGAGSDRPFAVTNGIERAALGLGLVALCVSPLAVAEDSPWLRPVEAIEIATEAYIFGYPLVTFDMARRQQTNVAVPDAEHAPMGQMIRMRTYPAVDNHCCAAPNADTLQGRGSSQEGIERLQTHHGVT